MIGNSPAKNTVHTICMVLANPTHVPFVCHPLASGTAVGTAVCECVCVIRGGGVVIASD